MHDHLGINSQEFLLKGYTLCCILCMLPTNTGWYKSDQENANLDKPEPK